METPRTITIGKTGLNMHSSKALFFSGILCLLLYLLITLPTAAFPGADSPRLLGASMSSLSITGSLIEMESATIAPGEMVNVAITATVPTTASLNAFTLHIEFDPTTIGYVSCNVGSDFTGVCNQSDDDGAAPDVISFSAVNPIGTNGVVELGNITFSGVTAATSGLHIEVATWSDGASSPPITVDGQLIVQLPATNTPLPTATNTPLPTATNTPLPTATNTPLPTATNTPLPTATNTPLPTATNTPLPTATNTPLPTATNTPLPTATNTPLPTATNTPLPTATNTPTADFVILNLLDSNGGGLVGGTAQYYSSGWQDIPGNTDANGELLTTIPVDMGNLTFRMSYRGASVNIVQDVSANPVVVFQTANVTVQLQDSQGNLLDTGSVQYYASGWKTFGDTTGGQVSLELLPKSYTFRMSYGGASVNINQNVGTNPVVIFQTTNVTVQLQDSNGNPLDTGSVQYYASGWQTFGDTTGGQASLELLPKKYTFRMSYGGASVNMIQDVSANPVVIFQTTNVTVQLQDSNGNPLDNGFVQYYAGGWKTFGDTTGGQVSLDLLPKSYTFRMGYGGASMNINQNVSIDPIVVFQTGQVNSVSDTATEYYASGWQTFTDGMELLPKTYTFRFGDGFPNTKYTIIAGTTNDIH